MYKTMNAKILTAFIFITSFLILFPLKLVQAKTMNKTALILHGWPQSIGEDSMYYKYFSDKGYNVIAPEIFSRDFELTEEEAKKYIESQLDGRKPDVIVGISMGGLLAPVIAKDYPEAKLIFIASGPQIESSSPGFKLVLNLAKNKRLLNILNIFKFMPPKVLYYFYEAINPFRGDDNQRMIYNQDMKINFKYIMKIPIDEEGEIVNFVTQTDNTELLKTLKNRTLIFTSDNDLMMPSKLGQDLHRLLVNSEIIISNGGHFNVFTEENFKDVDKFLLK